MRPNWWHGWRLPKRGRWALELAHFCSPIPELPRWSVRAGLELVGSLAVFVMTSLAFHLTNWLPFVIPIIGITSLASPPTAGIPRGGGGIASGATFVVSGRYGGTTPEAQISSTIAAAANAGALYVFVPASLLPYTASLVTFNTAIRMIREGADPTAYDIQAYGADPLGSADSTIAIQTALNSAMTTGTVAGASRTLSSVVIAPRGIYKCSTGTITVPFGVNVLGVSNGSIFDFSSAPAAVVAIQLGSAVPSPVNVADQPFFENLVLVGPGQGTTSIGIQLGGPTSKWAQGIMRNVAILTFGKGIKQGSNSFINTFLHLTIRSCGVGYEDIGALTLAGENMGFWGGSFAANTQHLNINPGNGGGVDYTFWNVSFDYATATPEAVLASAANIGFIGCHWETSNVGTAGNPVLVDIVFPSETLSFTDMQFVLAGGAPTGIPIAWDTGAAAGNAAILFNECRFQNPGSAFYGATAVGAATQPVVTVIGSTAMTGTAGKLWRTGLGRYGPPAVTLTDAATIVVDATAGERYTITLNVAGATRAMGTPTGMLVGQRITHTIIQDGTGGRALTWPAVFKNSWSDTGNTLNKRSTISHWWDGTNWNQDGAQTPYI